MPYRTRTYPLISCQQAVTVEASLLEGDTTKAWAAMQRAGAALADAIAQDFCELADWPADPRLLVLAGKGHNAGDALLAVAALARRFPACAVTILWAESADQLRPLTTDALGALRQAPLASLREFAWSNETRESLALEEFDVVLDGLLGLGFTAPLRQPYDAIIGWANHRDRQFGVRVAVDLPSGVGDGPVREAFRADFSYVLGLAKLPMEDERNAEWVGRPSLLDIGFYDAHPDLPATNRYWLDPRDALCQLQRLRPAGSHKYHFGQVAVVAGSLQYPGAALMCMSGALRAGPGLVTGIVPNVLSSRLAQVLPEVTWMPVASRPDGGLEAEVVRAAHYAANNHTRCFVVGPGLLADRNSLFNITRVVREVALPMVLDASALMPEVVPAVMGRPQNSGPVILTPHLGEYHRLVDRREAATDFESMADFCQRFRVVLVLKGRITRVCDGERLIATATGGPVLARGGTGDILAGMIGGLIAQDPENWFDAVLRAIAWHGAAAEAMAARLGQVSPRTTELLDYLPLVLRPRLRRA